MRMAQGLNRDASLLSHVLGLVLLGHLRIHLAVLGPPAVAGLLADLLLPANLGYLQPFAQSHVGLPQLGHDLFRLMAGWILSQK